MKLGVNIDHVATLRNARGGAHPDPVEAAQLAIAGGADLITAHLREDRRHIRDADIEKLRRAISVPLNMEMAVTPEMVDIALAIRPQKICLVPEKRTEITTEGGLDVRGHNDAIAACTQTLQEAGMEVSLFVDPDSALLDAIIRTGAKAIEIHTGAYANAPKTLRGQEIERIGALANAAYARGIKVHAGHGLTFENMKAVAALAPITELNIGHFLIGEAVAMGLSAAVAEMKRLMAQARQKVAA